VGYCLSSTDAYEAARAWFERAVAAKQQGDEFGRVDQDSLDISRRALEACLAEHGRDR
jgi:hypothetical protein